MSTTRHHRYTTQLPNGQVIVPTFPTTCRYTANHTVLTAVAVAIRSPKTGRWVELTGAQFNRLPVLLRLKLWKAWDEQVMPLADEATEFVVELNLRDFAAIKAQIMDDGPETAHDPELVHEHGEGPDDDLEPGENR